MQPNDQELQTKICKDTNSVFNKSKPRFSKNRAMNPAASADADSDPIWMPILSINYSGSATGPEECSSLSRYLYPPLEYRFSMVPLNSQFPGWNLALLIVYILLPIWSAARCGCSKKW